LKSILVSNVFSLETGPPFSFLCRLFLSACVVHLVKESPEFINNIFPLDLNSEENEIFQEF